MLVLHDNRHMKKEKYLTEEKFKSYMDRFENGIMTAVQRGFQETYDRMDYLHNSLRDEMNRKFDGVHARMDDIVENRATRSELKDLEKRVDVLEHKIA